MTLQEESRPSRRATILTLRTTCLLQDQRLHRQQPQQQVAVTATSTRWAEYLHTCDALFGNGSREDDVDADIISHLTGFQDTAASSRGRYRLKEVCVEKKATNVICHF